MQTLIDYDASMPFDKLIRISEGGEIVYVTDNNCAWAECYKRVWTTDTDHINDPEKFQYYACLNIIRGRCPNIKGPFKEPSNILLLE